MNGRSRSSLFLMEQLIVITIFAICASVCVKIFIGSYLTANDARDINHALAVAKNCAEYYKANGDLLETAAALGGRGRGEGESRAAAVYYDKKWRVCGAEEAEYVLRLEPAEGGAALPPLCVLSVEKTTGEEIVGFTVAAGRARGGRRK